MSRFKKILVALLSLTFLQLSLVPALSYAQFEPLDKACTGKAASSDVCDSRGQDDDPISGENGLLLKAVGILSWVVGVAAVIMIIIGGLKMVSSAGDANSFKSGRNTVIYALVGVVVVLISRALILFVVNKV